MSAEVAPPAPDADGRVVGDAHVLGALDMRVVPARTGDFAMEMPVGAHVANTRGGLQGGLLATLVDVVSGIAAADGLDPELSVATADLSMHFLSAVTVGPARAEAHVLRRGRTKIVVRVDVHDMGRDVLAAVSTLTFVIVPLRPEQMAADARWPRRRG